MQYFGKDPLRGWTLPAMIMPYEGRAKYEESVERIKNSPTAQKSVRTKLLNKFAVKQTYKKEWEGAVTEAEDAFRLERQPRIEQYTFEYSCSNKIKRKIGQDSPASTSTSSKKNKKNTPLPEDIYDFDAEDEGLGKNIETPLFLWSQKRSPLKGDFNVYLSKSMKQEKLDNPDLTEKDIETKLTNKWSLMSEDLKARYANRSPQTNSPVSVKTQRSAAKVFLGALNKQKAKRKLGGKQIRSIDTETSPECHTPTTLEESQSDDDRALVIADTPSLKKSKPPPLKLKLKKESITPTGKKKKTEPKSKTKIKNTDTLEKIQTTKPENMLTMGLATIPLDVECSADDTVDTASSLSEQELNENKVVQEIKICNKCHEVVANEIITCAGQCLQNFHKTCINDLPTDATQYMCNECTTGMSYFFFEFNVD